MKKTFKFISSFLLLTFFLGCSGIKVLDAWKSDSVADIKDNNLLVIARTSNNQARIAFESEITKQLTASGFNATSSYSVFPANMNPEKELTDEQRKNFTAFLNNEGYNGVVVTVIKDYQESTRTTTDGGYYAGGTYSAYYPMYYGGFYGYYHHPYSYSTFGSYIPSTTTTSTVKTFILETVAYDLDQEDGKQLAAVVTSKIEDPQDVTKNAQEYTKKITEALQKK
jgi:hypothetical protein